MAKALYGAVVGVDPRASLRVSHENMALRQRIADLEALVATLQEENDRLSGVSPEPEEVQTRF